MATETYDIAQQTFSSLRDEVIILIVEDNQGHYTLTKHCLRQAGIDNKVVWLPNGQEALDYLRGEGNPAINSTKYIMLLDIRMPKVDGIEVLSTIKQDEVLKDISVIMLTTSADQQIARKCYELGCDAHIIKPPGEVLLKAIDRVSQRI
ncbi:MAG: response regulator [Planctomycetes bacterium]|nr:response regulator [Planctomycetota bacterium]